MKTLNDVLPDEFAHDVGFFISMNSPPWQDDNFARLLDLQIRDRYGGRIITPFVNRYVGLDGKLSGFTYISTLLEKKYSTSWRHLIDVSESEYNLLDNYNGDETETTTTTLDTTNEVIHNVTDTTTTTSESVTNNQGTDSVFGYDSTSSVDANKSNIDSTGSSEGNSTNTKTGSEKELNTGTNSVTRTFNRHGNLGVTTSQDMLTQEVDFWKWNLMDSIIETVKNDLTLRTYA